MAIACGSATRAARLCCTRTCSTVCSPACVVAESVWPNAAFEGGIGINALTSDDPAPPMGGAVFHDTAVWLRSAVAEMPLAAE